MQPTSEIRQAGIVIISQTAGGSGFAHRTDDGATVFVPKSVMAAASLEVLGRYDAELVPNAFKKDVPWMAIKTRRQSPTEDPANLPSFITQKEEPHGRKLH